MFIYRDLLGEKIDFHIINTRDFTVTLMQKQKAQPVGISVCLALFTKVILKKNIKNLNMTGFQIDT